MAPSFYNRILHEETIMKNKAASCRGARPCAPTSGDLHALHIRSIRSQNPLLRSPLIEMEQIAKVFKTITGDFTALKGINARFYRGEFVSVVGKSGSGKSTLVNMLTGIDHPTSGKVRVDGVEIHHMGESDMAAWRGLNLGVVFQFFQLLPTLTLLENILLPMDFTGKVLSEEREERAMDLLKLVGLHELADKIPAELSGGQQQSAAIARALANDPPIIIADEPTGNLDSRTAVTVFEFFAGLVQNGKTIIMVTHDPSLAQRTTRTILLKDGEIVDEIIRTPIPVTKGGGSHA